MDQKDNYTKVFLKAADQPFDTPDIKNKRTLWWYNIRDVGGLRLTEEAITHIEQIAKIKTYKVDFPKEFKILKYFYGLTTSSNHRII